jgi:hypothetical protein
LVNQDHLASLEVPVLKVTWAAPDLKVAKACKAHAERLANQEFLVKQVLLARLVKMV